MGGTIPIAVGAAFTAKRDASDRVVSIFLGDGAMEAGVVHESEFCSDCKPLFFYL